MKYSQLTRPFLCLSGWNMVSAKSSPCKSIFPHWDLWFRRGTVIRLALFPACHKAEPWQMQSFLCRCKSTFAHWNFWLAQPPNCNRHYLALKKFQSEFKYGEPFSRQVGAWKRPCFPMVRYQPLREVVYKEPHQHVWNSCAIIEPWLCSAAVC